jgi:MFS family permease
MPISRKQLAFTLLVLFGINTMNFYDRQIVGAVGELVRKDWDLNDRELSSLTIAFILLYAAVGLPLGHWADVGRRKLILAIGVLLWSVMTALSGLAWNFTSLFVMRLGVGVGEASCAPTANSLLGDLFPPHQRARAIAVFMLGLPIGLGLSYVVSGYIARELTWRAALFVAGLPGLGLGILAFWLPDPQRGASETHSQPSGRRDDPPKEPAILAVLRIPTMWWIILSGALLNLNMYALGSFLTSFLMRYHQLEQSDANLISGVVYGFAGGTGMLASGWLGDRLAQRHIQRRLQLATAAMVVAAPCLLLAIQQPRGAYLAFAGWLLPGCFCLYCYYSTVYASIQDVVAPTMRGTAMAVYFFVFYLFTVIGLFAFGWLSDALARHYLENDWSTADASALGLHDALYSLPIVTVALIAVLFAASGTVARDHERLSHSSGVRSQRAE